jgi:hypothetical protein
MRNVKTAVAGVLLAGAAIGSTSLAFAEEMPSQADMWKMIQQQQKQIDSLTKELKKTEEKAEAVTEVVESQVASGSSGKSGWWDRTQVGGYGELHYNGGDKDQIDFHRFVLMVNHQYNERIRLFTELELEHTLSGDDKPGEVELEQAWIEFDITEEHRAKAGLFLVPVGMLNENHEPTTFFGTERNPVENNIIPTTWWEAGAGLAGEISSNLRYDLAFHSGLETPTDGDKAFKIRDGRQKVAEASANDGAVTGRLRWSVVNGVELGFSGQYQNDITQSTLNESIHAVLLAAHTNIRKGPFGFKALYAHWDLDGEAPKANGRDEQEGWFVEPAYYLDTDIGNFGVFGRYNQFDNESGNAEDSKFEQYDVGLNYWPHEQVVLKADMSFIDAPEGKKNDNILNLGVGFTY